NNSLPSLPQFVVQLPENCCKLQMDFRGIQKDTSIIGIFLYHCHILEHEDNGMMASIEVKSHEAWTE
ncbi:MAG: multicopper oxidase domain-containing protein, partial [Nostoc sp.]